ncbi:MAG: glycosyltransferase [Deltaproteobacteria bacterium]|nr:glycosyltransferase [Candidatus Zymogenaceae bacterium]
MNPVDLILFVIMMVFLVQVVANRMSIREPTVAIPKDFLPTVSVIIPARNEARTIGACVKSILAQSFDKFEIIVVDDGSTDNTAQVVSDIALTEPSVTLIRGRELPPHWFGKPYAQYEALKNAKGKYLLFLDADVILTRRALAMLLAAATQRGAGIVSMLPALSTDSFWENLVTPFIYFHLYLLFPAYAMNWPWEPLVAHAHNRCFLLEREMYKRIGGHSKASETIREAQVMAREVKAKGGKIGLLSGESLCRVRPYGPPPNLWDGLIRHHVSTASRSAMLSISFAAISFVLFVLPWLQLVSYLMGDVHTLFGVMVPIANVLLGAVMYLTATGRYGLTLGRALLVPLAALAWIVTIFRAIGKVSGTGTIQWKGRTVKP